jgi:tetratricopeptide (TPR) repeat protein
VLPTPVLNATPTPGVDNLGRPLWTKVEIAFSQEDWGAAVTALDQIRSMDPQNAKARGRLSAALYERALDSIAENELELAKRDLDRAVILNADSPNLQSTRRDVELYRSAVEVYLEQDWAQAVFLLTEVYKRTPNFRDTTSMLGQAHCHLAEQQLGSDNLEEALSQATLCEQILQGDEDAAALVKRVTETIRPPRRIEVTLSDFRTRVYENNEVIKSFPICYGRASYPTKTGRFQVQTKMDNAYGSAWDLNMPWWLGIYWAGGTENGFHALPILSSGATLWAGSLGTRCSFGCIVLGTEEAKWLYDWATLGTVVFVNP